MMVALCETIKLICKQKNKNLRLKKELRWENNYFFRRVHPKKGA